MRDVLVVVGVALVVVVLGLAAVLGIAGPRPSVPSVAEPPPTIVVTVQAQVRATVSAVTPTATSAPARPTATSIPVTPTAVPTPTVTRSQSEERAYTSYALEETGYVLQALVLADKQQQKLFAVPSLMHDSQWRLATAATLANAMTVGKSLQPHPTAPESMKVLDKQLVNVGIALLAFSLEYSTAIDDQDVNLFVTANEDLISIGKTMVDVARDVGTLRLRYNLPLPASWPTT